MAEPLPDDPNWVPYADRLDPVNPPGVGVFTLTAWAMDEAGNISRGLSGAQRVVMPLTTRIATESGEILTTEAGASLIT